MHADDSARLKLGLLHLDTREQGEYWSLKRKMSLFGTRTFESDPRQVGAVERRFGKDGFEGAVEVQ